MIAVNPLDSASVLAAFGALGVLAVIFAESGLLVFGFFLPGDTLLFPAGVLCAGTAGQPARLALWQVLLCAAIGAVAGGQVGYLIGRHGGRALLARSSSRRVKGAAARAEDLLARYGYGKALVIGRFVPLLRTVLHPVAGALGVPARPFTLWQTVGGVLWSQALVLAGFTLGASVPAVDDYLLLLVAAVVVLSMLPLLVEARRRRRERRAEPEPEGPADSEGSEGSEGDAEPGPRDEPQRRDQSGHHDR
ncbi:DedA family protein [Streptomyces murinus]|uniref:DedA family protein n=1 Tax=Streptomyces murinus TaxID=33900 RepID=UPI0037F8949E